MSTKELQYGEMIGAVRLSSRWRFFAGTIAEWILDYASYDPTYDPSKSPVLFRGGLLTVDETKAKEFCNAMSEREFTANEVLSLVTTKGTDKVPLVIAINFDEKLLISSFYDIAIEDYVPEGWQGVFDDPLKYVPDEIRAIWQPFPARASYHSGWRET